MGSILRLALGLFSLVLSGAVGAQNNPWAVGNHEHSDYATRLHQKNIKPLTDKARSAKRMDLTPPVLLSVTLPPGRINAGIQNVQIPIRVAANDEWSGLKTIGIGVTGPNGQNSGQTWFSTFPMKGEQKIKISVPMDMASQDGIWKVTAVFLEDAAFNAIQYDGAELDIFGPLTFEVFNARGDSQAPSILSGGKNLSPKVSLSTPPPGLAKGTPPKVGALLKVQDAGVSGLMSASMNFCHVSNDLDCLYLVSGGPALRGQVLANMIVGYVVNGGATLGTYLLNSATITDFAYNRRTYNLGDPELGSLLDILTIEITE